MLQATAFVLVLATILWSLGLPTFRFAEAANVTSFSDTLSDSAPGALSDHTISFVATSGVASGESLTITFDAGFTDLGAIGTNDIDLATTSGEATLVDDGSETASQWGVATTSNTIVFTSGGANAVIGAGATVTIQVGLNATGGDAQITNPGTPGSYKINVNTTGVTPDTGETVIAIIPSVTVSASVDTSFDFTVRGRAPGVDINGYTTTGSSTAIAIPFGELQANTASTAGQQLEVSTNATNGYVVTVQVDQQLLSATGADIDAFSNGTFVTDPTAWGVLSPSIGDDDTYGHWGLTSEDATTTRTNEFGPQEFVAASTSPVVVMSHTGPANGTGDTGLTEVGYRIEISSLQEAANDYTATLTYVATPIF